MTDQRHERQYNAAWQAAQQWQERARQARPSRSMSGPRLFLTWLMFGTMLIVGTVLGLFFLLLGWLMLPLIRYRMKKRVEAFRAQKAQDIGGDYRGHARPHDTRLHVLEGDYEVRNNREP